MRNRSPFFIAMTCLAAVCAGPASSELRTAAAFPKKFVGFVRQMPIQGAGIWFVGSRNISSDAMTIIDDNRRPIVVGSCVLVEVNRGNRAARIAEVAPDQCFVKAPT